MESKRLGRPPKTSREEIVSAAALSSPDALQITTLASELGVAVKTVYNYFPNRAALLDAVRELSTARVPLPSPATASTWSDVLSMAARWHFDVHATHPGLAVTVGGAAASIELFRQVHARLVELGVQRVAAVRAQLVVSHWAMAAGAAAQRTAEAGGLDPENLHRVVDDYDSTAEVAELLSLVTLDDVFFTGLRVVLTGIEQELMGA